MTNRKSHTRFRLVPKSTTLRGHYALCFKTRASFGAHHENLNEDKLYYQRRRRSPITLDSDNKVYADIRSGFQDLCKFSWFYAWASILRIHVPHAFRYQVQLFCYYFYQYGCGGL